MRAFILLFLSGALSCCGQRALTSLDGRWDFQLDPQDLGRAREWFAAQVPFTNTIQVPGAWQAQGYGAETEKLRHHYVGQAWYKRQVRLPKLSSDQRLFLRVGNVHRSA